MLGRIDVEVAQAVRGEVELRDHRRGAEREVVAVADVHGGAGEPLAGGRAADVGAGLEHERAQPGAGEIGGGDQAVVAAADDDRVVVVARPGAGRDVFWIAVMTCPFPSVTVSRGQLPTA